MLEELADLVAGLFVGGGPFGFSSGARERRLAEQRAADFEAGNDVPIPCVLRDVSQAEPQWRYGELVLSEGRAEWIDPSDPPGESTVLDPDTTTVERVRQLSKSEKRSIARHSVMLRLDVAGEPYEIVIHSFDLGIVGKVLSIPRPAGSTAG